MDLQIVMQMFREIKKDLNEHKKDLPTEKLKKMVQDEDERSTVIKKLQKDLLKNSPVTG